MAAEATPFHARFRAAEAALVLCGLGLLAAFGVQAAHLARDAGSPRPAAAQTVSAPSEYQRAFDYERHRLPTLFVPAAAAKRLGLVITPNSFDLQSPPNPNSLFVQPLPGQNPISPMPVEFFAAGFVVGKAQSFGLRGVRRGRLTLIAWAFTSHQGAVRAFRAYRDVTGLAAVPDDYAPYAGLKGSREAGLEELFWVRGRLLLQSSYAAPQADLTRIRTAHRRLTAFLDERVLQQEQDPTPAPVLPDLSPVGRLLAATIPDDELPGGWSTSPEGSRAEAGAPQGGLAAPALDVAFGSLGLLGTSRQVIRIAGYSLGRIELAAQAYPSARAAQQALDVVAAQTRARPVRAAGIGPAVLVPGPGGLNYSDLWWRQGPLVLRASSYASRLAPLPAAYRRLVAQRLAERADLAMALAPA